MSIGLRTREIDKKQKYCHVIERLNTVYLEVWRATETALKEGSGRAFASALVAG